MTDPVVGKCYETLQNNKAVYVGRFIKRLGDGQYNSGMSDTFLQDGKTIEVISRYPDFHAYNEVSCKNVNKATGGRRWQTRRKANGAYRTKRNSQTRRRK
jgi:hypothetical protein